MTSCFDSNHSKTQPLVLSARRSAARNPHLDARSLSGRSKVPTALCQRPRRVTCEHFLARLLVVLSFTEKFGFSKELVRPVALDDSHSTKCQYNGQLGLSALIFDTKTNRLPQVQQTSPKLSNCPTHWTNNPKPKKSSGNPLKRTESHFQVQKDNYTHSDTLGLSSSATGIPVLKILRKLLAWHVKLQSHSS